MVGWVCEHEDLHSAEIAMCWEGRLHLLVESLGDTGWDWHVWDRDGLAQERYGLADSLEDAKARAEAALDTVRSELRLIRLLPEMGKAHC